MLALAVGPVGSITGTSPDGSWWQCLGTSGEAGETRPTALGITVTSLTDDLAEQFGHQNARGVLVESVEEDSPAGRAGLRVGDLITEVNRQAVVSVREFEQTLEAADKEKPVLFLVRSNGKSRFLIVPVE